MAESGGGSDAELMAWEGEGYPPALQPLLSRFRNPRWAELWVGRGWWPILVRLEQKLAELDPGFEVSQVKEKFGGLRVYLASYPSSELGDALRAVIHAAEREAARTCETCGRPGELRVSRIGAYRTLCADDAGNGFKRIVNEAESE